MSAITNLAEANRWLGAFARMTGTVGDAVAQAAAGPDGLPVSAHVAALTLFTPDGELRRADRNAHPELFRLAMGGQGVIGVFYSVTLSIDSLLSSAAAETAPVELRISEETTAQSPECAIECLLPPEALDAFLKDVRLLAEERRIALHGITVRRYRAEVENQAAKTGLRWATAAPSRSATCATPRAASWKPATRRSAVSSPTSGAATRRNACRIPGTGPS